MLSYRVPAVCALTVLGMMTMPAVTAGQPAPLTMETARVTVSGTSNIHRYSVWTDTVRVTRVKLAGSVSPDTFWDHVLEPGVLQAFEIAIPVATLTAREDGLNENMYRALKLEAHRDITFRLTSLERGAAGTVMAVGKLRIAGVEREVVLPLDTARRDDTLVVSGRLPLLMTDFGITPPTAMLGMLHTDPKVVVTFEVVLSIRET